MTIEANKALLRRVYSLLYKTRQEVKPETAPTLKRAQSGVRVSAPADLSSAGR